MHMALLLLALHSCPVNETPRPEIVVSLFEIERELGGPDWPTGLLAAAACQESGYTPAGRCGDKGKSCGIVQFQGWASDDIAAHVRPEDGCDADDARFCWQASARFWVTHVRAQYEKRDWVRKRCRNWNRYPTHRDRWWASANATAVWNPKDGEPHCTIGGHRYETKHWKRLRAWRREAAR